MLLSFPCENKNKSLFKTLPYQLKKWGQYLELLSVAPMWPKISLQPFPNTSTLIYSFQLNSILFILFFKSNHKSSQGTQGTL